MKISKKNLLRALEHVSGAVSTRTTLPVLMSVKLEAKDGKLSLLASNLEVWCIANAECEGDLEPFGVSYRVLSELVSRSGDTVGLYIEDGRLRFHSGFIANIPIVEADLFPAFPNDKATAIGVNVTDLADCIDAVRWGAAGETENRMWMQTVQVKCTAKGISCHAANGKTGGHIHRPGIAADCCVSIPAKWCDRLVAALRCKNAAFSISDNYAIGTSPDYTVAVRLMDAQYVDVHDQLLSKPAEELGKVDKGELMESISTIRSISQEAVFTPTRLGFSPNGLCITHEAQNRFETTLAGKFKKKEIFCDAAYAAQALKSCPIETPKFLHRDGMNVLSCGEYSAILMGCQDPKKPKQTTPNPTQQRMRNDNL